MGATKYCDIEYVDVEECEDESGGAKRLPGVRATCVDCGGEAESFGQTIRSIKRCMAHMKDVCECSDGEDAFFTCDELELHE